MRERFKKSRRGGHHSDEQRQECKNREHSDGHQLQAFRNHAPAPVPTFFFISKSIPNSAILSVLKGVTLSRAPAAIYHNGIPQAIGWLKMNLFQFPMVIRLCGNALILLDSLAQRVTTRDDNETNHDAVKDSHSPSKRERAFSPKSVDPARR